MRKPHAEAGSTLALEDPIFFVTATDSSLFPTRTTTNWRRLGRALQRLGLKRIARDIGPSLGQLLHQDLMRQRDE